MKGIGGKTKATFQVKAETGVSPFGTSVVEWTDVQTIKGWLDLSGGSSNYMNYAAKIQQSTHVFVADYVKLDSRIEAETARMVIGGKRYDIMLIDNPMELCSGSQLEIYLKYTGGQ